MLSMTMATLLFGRVGAESLTVAMANIKETAGFDPKEPPEHQTDIKVGLYLEHLLDVSIPKHTFDMDFYLTEEWLDKRNYSSLFADDNLVEVEPDQCEEQREQRHRNLFATPGNGRERRARRLAGRELQETTDFFEGNFDPKEGDFVKFTATWGTKATYNAKVVSIETKDGVTMYNIEYEDESKHTVSRPTTIGLLSSMPVPARRFVEFGHDELKLIWEPDVHITNLHQDMLTHEEVPPPPPMLSPPRLSSCPYHLKKTKCPPLAPATSRVSRSAGSFPSEKARAMDSISPAPL